MGPRIRLLRNALNAGSLRESEPFGLPTGSLTVMSLIAANPGCAQVDLAAMAGITGPSLVGIVTDLEAAGYISRERMKEDRRRNMLVLTQAGQAKTEELFAAVSQIEQPIVDELGARDTARLTELLDRAYAALTRDNA